MMMIMKLQIKLLPNLVGQPEYDPHQSGWYGNPILEVMLLDHDEPTNYEEAMMSPDFVKLLEAMKFEMGSMYENKVCTLVDLPNDRQAIEKINGSSRRRLTLTVMLLSTKLDLLRKVFDKFKGFTTMRLSHP